MKEMFSTLTIKRSCEVRMVRVEDIFPYRLFFSPGGPQPQRWFAIWLLQSHDDDSFCCSSWKLFPSKDSYWHYFDGILYVSFFLLAGSQIDGFTM